MKVKVSYTVDFENIPEVVRDIVKKAEKIQDEMAEVSAKLHAGDLGVDSLKSISDLRQMSSDLAESYSDCQSILSGFLSAAFALDRPALGEATGRLRFDVLVERRQSIHMGEPHVAMALMIVSI